MINYGVFEGSLHTIAYMSDLKTHIRYMISIIHFCLQYFKTSLKTRLSIVYVETWEDQDQAAGISKQIDINKALDDLSSYARRKLFDVEKDTTQMFT